MAWAPDKPDPPGCTPKGAHWGQKRLTQKRSAEEFNARCRNWADETGFQYLKNVAEGLSINGNIVDATSHAAFSSRERLAAIMYLINRGYGTPTDKLAIEGKMSLEQLVTAAATYQGKLKDIRVHEAQIVDDAEEDAEKEKLPDELQIGLNSAAGENGAGTEKKDDGEKDEKGETKE